MNLLLLDGPTSSGKLRFGLRASQEVIEYVVPYLSRRLYLAQPTMTGGEDRFGDVSAPRWGLDLGCDLTLTEIDDAFEAGPSTSPALVLPSRVEMVARLDGVDDPVRDLLSRNRRRAHRRRVKRHGYRFSCSTLEGDLERFYWQDYLPTMAMRHGAEARTSTWDQARGIFGAGMLLLVHDGAGSKVAGIVCGLDPVNDVVHSRLGGVAAGRSDLWREGASQAADVLLYEWASIHGYAEVNLQGGEPFLDKGSLQAKRALGASPRVPNGVANHRLLMSVLTTHEGLVEFLVANPFFALDPVLGLHVTTYGRTKAETRALGEHWGLPALGMAPRSAC